ncbi:MAG: elongation factor P [Candidatus Omnitrophica bacterium]|nr:elongation factor P [Candidatus Omnitrophota bacterium]
MALSINEVKVGVTIFVDSQVWLVVDTQHVKPGKGAAFVRAKLRNLKNSSIQDMTFRGDEKVEEAFVEERKLQYQYSSGDTFHFMDQETFEDISIPEEALAERKKFLKDNIDVSAYFYKDDLLNVNLPNFIECVVKSSEPGIRGDTAKSGTKPAMLETGAVIQVPLFINEGDKIKVDTRTGSYVERVP